MTTVAGLRTVVWALVAIVVVSTLALVVLPWSRHVGFVALVASAALFARARGWEVGLIVATVSVVWWFVLSEDGKLRRIVDDTGTVRLGFLLFALCLALMAADAGRRHHQLLAVADRHRRGSTRP